MSFGDKKTSYIRARDPSLVSASTFRPPARLVFERMSTISNSDEDIANNHVEVEDEDSGKMDVYLRIKVTESDEHIYQITDDNTLICQVPDDSQAGRNVRDGEQVNRIYTFTRIFPPHALQTEVFDSVVRRKVLKFINGENTNLLTYGPSGSGKTFTIVGTKENPGMLPQSLEYIFRSLPPLTQFPTAKPIAGKAGLRWLTADEGEHEVEALTRILVHYSDDMEVHRAGYTAMQKRLSREPVAQLEVAHGTRLGVWISFAEVYNECVFDLLHFQGGRKRARKILKIHNNNGETYIKDLKQVYVTNGHEAYCVLQYGLLNLRYAATTLNTHSSRSHCIFTITLVQFADTQVQNVGLSHINFCDLAGSERTKKTNNVGCRLNESNNINTSLFVLGRCINAIRKSQKSCSKRGLMIPFRESKLTQLFHRALQGEEDISIIVAISPERSMFDETIQALNFAAIAKEISIKDVSLVKEPSRACRRLTLETNFSANEYEAKIAELLEQVESLRALNQEQLEKYDQRETFVRRDLIARFKEMAARKQDEHDEEMERALEEKDEIIEALRDELAARQPPSDADSSVISISSCDTSLVERMTDLHTANKRFHELKKEHCKYRDDSEMEKLILTAQIEELKEKNRVQEEVLKLQKLDIIKLTDENQCLDADLCHSIRYTNGIVEQFEENLIENGFNSDGDSDRSSN